MTKFELFCEQQKLLEDLGRVKDLLYRYEVALKNNKAWLNKQLDKARKMKGSEKSNFIKNVNLQYSKREEKFMGAIKKLKSGTPISSKIPGSKIKATAAQAVQYLKANRGKAGLVATGIGIGATYAGLAYKNRNNKH